MSFRREEEGMIAPLIACPLWFNHPSHIIGTLCTAARELTHHRSVLFQAPRRLLGKADHKSTATYRVSKPWAASSQTGSQAVNGLACLCTLNTRLVILACAIHLSVATFSVRGILRLRVRLREFKIRMRLSPAYKY